jgi:hypothetical protein
MLPRFYVTKQRQTAIKRIVLCCGSVRLSFLAIVGFSLLERIQTSQIKGRLACVEFIGASLFYC